MMHLPIVAKKTVALAVVIAFLASGVAQAQGVPAVRPLQPQGFPLLRYLSVNSANPFNYFNFLMEPGTIGSDKGLLDKESRALVNYFLAAVTIPNSDLWVNLQPGQGDRIISETLASTELGRVLLEQDLLLKRDTAKALHPENPAGRAFWKALYTAIGEKEARAAKLDVANRVWIVPDEAVLYETADGAYIVKATMKVLSENEYLKQSPRDERQALIDALFKEHIIPQVAREINTAPRYAPLRQAFMSLILAEWYKRKHGGEPSAYALSIGKGYIKGLQSSVPWSRQAIWKRYIDSYRSGEYTVEDVVFGVRRLFVSGGIYFGFGGSSPVAKGMTPGLAGPAGSAEEAADSTLTIVDKLPAGEISELERLTVVPTVGSPVLSENSIGETRQAVVSSPVENAVPTEDISVEVGKSVATLQQGGAGGSTSSPIVNPSPPVADSSAVPQEKKLPRVLSILMSLRQTKGLGALFRGTGFDRWLITEYLNKQLENANHSNQIQDELRTVEAADVQVLVRSRNIYLLNGLASYGNTAAVDGLVDLANKGSLDALERLANLPLSHEESKSKLSKINVQVGRSIDIKILARIAYYSYWMRAQLYANIPDTLQDRDVLDTLIALARLDGGEAQNVLSKQKDLESLRLSQDIKRLADLIRYGNNQRAIPIIHAIAEERAKLNTDTHEDDTWRFAIQTLISLSQEGFFHAKDILVDAFAISEDDAILNEVVRLALLGQWNAQRALLSAGAKSTKSYRVLWVMARFENSAARARLSSALEDGDREALKELIELRNEVYVNNFFDQSLLQVDPARFFTQEGDIWFVLKLAEAGNDKAVSMLSKIYDSALNGNWLDYQKLFLLFILNVNFAQYDRKGRAMPRIDFEKLEDAFPASKQEDQLPVDPGDLVWLSPDEKSRLYSLYVNHQEWAKNAFFSLVSEEMSKEMDDTVKADLPLLVQPAASPKKTAAALEFLRSARISSSEGTLGKLSDARLKVTLLAVTALLQEIVRDEPGLPYDEAFFAGEIDYIMSGAKLVNSDRLYVDSDTGGDVGANNHLLFAQLAYERFSPKLFVDAGAHELGHRLAFKSNLLANSLHEKALHEFIAHLANWAVRSIISRSLESEFVDGSSKPWDQDPEALRVNKYDPGQVQTAIFLKLEAHAPRLLVAALREVAAMQSRGESAKFHVFARNAFEKYVRELAEYGQSNGVAEKTKDERAEYAEDPHAVEGVKVVSATALKKLLHHLFEAIMKGPANEGVSYSFNTDALQQFASQPAQPVEQPRSAAASTPDASTAQTRIGASSPAQADKEKAPLMNNARQFAADAPERIDEILLRAAARTDNPQIRRWLKENLRNSALTGFDAPGAYAVALYLSENDRDVAKSLADYIARVLQERSRGNFKHMPKLKRELIALMAREAWPWDSTFGTTSADNDLFQSQYRETRVEVVNAGYGVLLDAGLNAEKTAAALKVLKRFDPFSNDGARQISFNENSSLQKIILDLAILAVLQETVASFNVPAFDNAYFVKEQKYIILCSSFDNSSMANATLINGRASYRKASYLSLVMTESHELGHRMLRHMGFFSTTFVRKAIHELIADTAKLFVASWLLGMHDGVTVGVNNAMLIEDKIGFERNGIKQLMEQAANTGLFGIAHAGARVVIRWLIEEAGSLDHPFVWKHLLQVQLETVADYVKRNVGKPSFRGFVADVLKRYVRIIDPDASLAELRFTDDTNQERAPGQEELPSREEINTLFRALDQGAKSAAARTSGAAASSPAQADMRNYELREERPSGGIDFTQIELTLANDEALAGMNAADRKILRAAQALKDGWQSLAALYCYEAAQLVRDKIVVNVGKADILTAVAGAISDSYSIDLRNIVPLKSPAFTPKIP